MEGKRILVVYTMTENGKASTQSLTGEAYDEGKGQEGNSVDPDAWGDWMREHYETVLKPKWSAWYKDNKGSWESWTRLKYDEKQDWEFYLLLQKQFDPLPDKAKNGRPKGTWELTLTYSPKWYQDDTEAQEAFKQAERRLLKYYVDELELYRSVGEFTRDGRAHLHIIYRLGSGGKFTDKNIRRAYPHWDAKKVVGKGVQGGHHAICESASDYAGYIEKHLNTAWHHYEHNHAVQSSQAHTASRVLEGQHWQAGQGTQGRPSNEVYDEDSGEGDCEAGDG